MAKLEAMLEQRGIATPREMSEAIARCQLHGGDVTTSLLQFVSADEAQLSAALSECYGLPAAAVGLLPAPDDAALRSLPRDVAEGYCCFPLEASPGRLVLAVARPLEPALREELGSTLGVSIEERVALEVRIRQAQSRCYGVPLSARNQRGIARLEGDLEAAGQETPLGLWSDAQLSTLPRPPSDLSSARESQRPPSVRPRPRSDAPRSDTARNDSPRSDAPRNGLAASSPPNSGTRSSRRRGPLSLARAREELARAPTRNDVLDIFFGFASQFFEYSALFAVHNALAEGLDAWGKGADRETVLGIGVPLDLPSSLSEVAESCKVRLTRLGKEGIDRTLAADLQRQFNAKALVLPVSLRGRCAVLLYADNGEADVLEREIADVIAIAPDVANALGRIILQRKKEARQRGSDNSDLSELARRSSQPPPVDEGGGVPSLLDALEPIPNENRERSRNNARKSSRPDASPAPLKPERDPSVVAGQRVVSIGPDRDGVSPSPPASEVGARSDAGEDPVFLLARPQGKARLTPLPPEPRPLPTVERPPISITHPAPIIGNRPRLPSVIVDPESADPEASERMTRAAAITRAPAQARSAPGRRPLVPLLADAPRTLSPPVYDPTVRPGRSGNAAAGRGAVREGQSGSAREREGQRGEAPLRQAPLREPEPTDPVEAALTEPQVAPREALHPGSVDLSEPPPADDELQAEASGDDFSDSDEADDEEALGPTSNAWPPPIMDHSPPPRQPPLTALVPIIIADAPKSRRGYTSRTATTARPGSRPGAAKASQSRVTSSSPPAHGPASPTVPSPARARKVEASLGDRVAGVRGEQPLDAPVAILSAPSPLTNASNVGAPLAPSTEAARALGDAKVPATAGATAPSIDASSSPRPTNALARAAARAASAAAPRQADAGRQPVDARFAAATTAPPPGPAISAATRALPGDAASRRDVGQPVAAAQLSRASSPLEARGGTATPSEPRPLPPVSEEREQTPAAQAHPEASGTPGAAASSEAERSPSSTVMGLGTSTQGPAAASSGSMSSGSMSSGSMSSGQPGSTPANSSSASLAPMRVVDARPTLRADAATPSLRAAVVNPLTGERAGVTEGTSQSSTLIGVAALGAATEGASQAERSSSTAGPDVAQPVARAGVSRSDVRADRDAIAGTSRRSPPESAARAVSPSAPPSAASRSVAPAPMLAVAGHDAPPDSVELAWDALISEPPPPPAAPSVPASAADAPSPARPAPSARSSVSNATPAAGTPASLLSLATPSGDAGRAIQPAPGTTPSSSNSSAVPSNSHDAAPSSPRAAPSSPLHPLPSRPIDSARAAPSRPSHAPPSRPGSGSRPATSASVVLGEAPGSGAGPSSSPVASSSGTNASGAVAASGAGPSSSSRLAPASGTSTGEARAAIFPPPPPENAEIEELVDQVCQGNLRAVQDLARIGAPSVPQVMARFPGPVISERAGPSSRASECGPLLQALAAIGSPAMPSVTSSSEHQDARVRRWATLLLGEMPSPEACRAVVQRLADDVPRVHQAALDAARLLLSSSAADLFRKTLFEVAEAEDAPLTLRLRTLEHVAKLKDSASVPRLISFLGADMEPIVHKALWALTVVTRHDFGRDARAWMEFWTANQARHRLEWLIDALDDRDPRLRKAAADELREEAGELFGYAEDQPRPERLQAQREFRRWWDTTGVQRHARP